MHNKIIKSTKELLENYENFIIPLEFVKNKVASANFFKDLCKNNKKVFVITSDCSLQRYEYLEDLKYLNKEITFTQENIYSGSYLLSRFATKNYEGIKNAYVMGSQSICKELSQ